MYDLIPVYSNSKQNPHLLLIPHGTSTKDGHLCHCLLLSKIILLKSSQLEEMSSFEALIKWWIGVFATCNKAATWSKDMKRLVGSNWIVVKICKEFDLQPFHGVPLRPQKLPHKVELGALAQSKRWSTKLKQLTNIARGTTDPGYWLFNLSYLSI